MDFNLKKLLLPNLTMEEYLKLVPLRAGKVHLTVESLAIVNRLLADKEVPPEELKLVFDSLILQSAAADVNIPKLYVSKKERFLINLLNEIVAAGCFRKGGYTAELDYSTEDAYGYKIDTEDWFAQFHLTADDIFEEAHFVGDKFTVTFNRTEALCKEKIAPFKQWLHKDTIKFLKRFGIFL